MLAGGAVGTGAVAWGLWRAGWARGRGPAVRRGVERVEAAVWLLGAAMMVIAPMFGAAAASGIFGVKGDDEALARMGALQLGASVAGVAVGVLLVAMFRRAAGDMDGRVTGLRAEMGDAWRGTLGLVLVAPVYILTSEVSRIVQERIDASTHEPIQHTTLKALESVLHGGAAEGGVSSADRAWAWVIVSGVVIAVPVIEELMYRGFMQSFFVRLLRSARREAGRDATGAAIVLTSIVFAAMHVGTGAVPWSAAGPLFVLSLGLGFAFEKTGRLGVSIVMHGVFNGLNILAVAVGGVG